MSGKERLAKNLKRFKGAQTERELARRLGVSSGTVNKILNRELNITITTLDKIASALGVDVTDLLKER